jgi:hypothetical protein
MAEMSYDSSLPMSQAEMEQIGFWQIAKPIVEAYGEGCRKENKQPGNG